jgi:DNA-binding NarL/FixJ family response regulator
VIRVLVVDDHPLFRYGLRCSLESASDIDVVGEAVNGTAAIVLANSLKPDVVVMDLNMPGLTGIEAIRRIVEDNPAVSVLVLTMLDDDESVFAAMRSGARGYLLKGTDPDDVICAIRVVGKSEAIFGPSIASRLLAFVATAAPQRSEVFPELTERECDILWLVARGESNDMIARRLVLSSKTVRNHVSNIYRKLKVTDRAEAVARVKAANLGTRNGAETGLRARRIGTTD